MTTGTSICRRRSALRARQGSRREAPEPAKVRLNALRIASRTSPSGLDFRMPCRTLVSMSIAFLTALLDPVIVGPR